MSSITYAQYQLKMAILVGMYQLFGTIMTDFCHFVDVNKMVTFCHRFAVLGNMVRNAGQLPQPFWLGATCGGGSRSAARCAART